VIGWVVSRTVHLGRLDVNAEIRECGFALRICLTIVAARRKRPHVTGELTADFTDRKIPVAKTSSYAPRRRGFLFALIRVKPEVQRDSQVIQQTYHPR